MFKCNNPRSITGHDENRFVVNGSSATGGFLLRERISQADGTVTFPIGSTDNSYTPAAISSHSGVSDDFYARGFDSTKMKVTDGDDMSAQSVNKTWQVGKRFYPGLQDVDLSVQHQLGDEGSYFKTNRQSAYVSRYNNGVWDLGLPQSTPTTGNLTTGAALNNSGLNTRPFAGMGAALFIQSSLVKEILRCIKQRSGSVRIAPIIIMFGFTGLPNQKSIKNILLFNAGLAMKRHSATAIAGIRRSLMVPALIFLITETMIPIVMRV